MNTQLNSILLCCNPVKMPPNSPLTYRKHSTNCL